MSLLLLLLMSLLLLFLMSLLLLLLVLVLLQIPCLLGDSFRLLAVPTVADAILCLSPDSVSFLSFSGGSCGGGSQRLLDGQQQQQQQQQQEGYSSSSSSSRTAGLTHILNPGGLVRRDLLELPSVVFDKSVLRLRLDGAAAAFIGDRCLFLIAADGRPALAHLVSDLLSLPVMLRMLLLGTG